jgi:hypothetical protein
MARLDHGDDVPPAEQHVSGDPAKMLEGATAFFTAYRSLVDDIGSGVEKSLEVNKQIAALYERFLLVDIGTIALSVTAITSLASRPNAVPTHKYTFVLLIGLAWLLLLPSTFCCRAMITAAAAGNAKILHEWRGIATSLNLQQVARACLLLSKAISGTAVVQGEKRDMSAFFSSMAHNLIGVVNEEQQKRLEKALQPADQSGSVKITGRVAIAFMQLGLIVLCAAAMMLVFTIVR